MIKFIIGIFAILALCLYCESQQDPFEEGMHFGYNIKCINGFKYKCTKHTETILLESDSKPMKCK